MVSEEPISIHRAEGVAHVLKYTTIGGWINRNINSTDSNGCDGSPDSQLRFTSYNGKYDELHLFWSYRSSLNVILRVFM